MIRRQALFCARVTCAMSWGLLPLVWSALLAGCGEQGSSVSPQSDEGKASIVGLALTSADVSSVGVTVTGGGLSNPIVFPLQKNGNQWSALASGIPAGAGYTFALAAQDANNATIYSGSATGVAVVKNQTVEVVITGQQVNPPAPFQNAPPVVDSVIASSVNVAPGDTVSLVATAHDPNAGDSLTYNWSATNGAFSASSGSSTNWTAASAGTTPITLTVTDQAGASVTVQIQIVVAANAGKGSADITATLNTWPVVSNVIGTPNYLVKGTASILTAQASDADGDSLVYAWTSNCAGTFSSTQVPMPSFTLDSASTATSCTLTVAVTDGHGGSTSGTLVLPVGKPLAAAPPTISQVTQTLTDVSASDTVVLSVQAADPQSLALTFAWTASGGALSNQSDAAGRSQITWAPPASAASSWTITASVTDSAGLSVPYVFTIRPKTCFGPAQPTTAPWRFAVMADTQWTMTDDGKNPNSVAVDIVNQLNAQFIAKGVKFVVAAGDVTDNGSNLALDTRAEFAQALYNAGIGFYPLRGNHESSATAAAEFVRIFPQTKTGQQNATPSNVFIANSDDVNTHPVTPNGSPFVVGSSFSSPSTALAGLSYSFDYGNARFVLLDQFTPADGSANTIDAQQSWITSTLSGRPAGSHAFVFGHKGIITEDHVDTLFGDDPSLDPAGQDAFITSLAQGGVRYYMGGHDHMHNRALVTTTDGTTASIQNIILASDSSKFYTPAATPNDVTYDMPAFGHTRETPIAQELDTIGYYIVTIVDGRATVDFYSAAANPASGTIATTPVLDFTKRESYGYGLNGKQFVIRPSGSYTSMQDSFAGTTAQILAGTNVAPGTDGGGRQFSKTVDTAWSNSECGTSSATLDLSITGALGTGQTDTYALSMSYDPTTASATQIGNGGLGIAVKDVNGNWVNAVDKDFGGTKTFVLGAWQSSYGLGTYGIDTATNTAWAVINHSSDFAVAPFPGVGAVSGKILAINDFHGQISAGKTVSGHPVGDAAVLASYLKTAMAGNDANTVLVETGDLVGASPASSALLQDEPSVDFFNYFANAECPKMPQVALQSTGIDRFDGLLDPGCNLIGIPGNHEFDEGVDELMRLMGGGNHAKGPFIDNPWAGARFPLIAANIWKSNGELLFRPYAIKSIGGLRVAFVGAGLKDTPSVVIPSGVAGLTFGDEADAINTQVTALHAMGIHAIVAVIHNGGSQTSYTGTTKPSATAPSSDIVGIINRLDADVDIAITAHSHSFTNAYVKNAGNKDVLVTQAYSASTAYANIDFTLDPASQDITAKSASIVTTYADATGLVPDATMAALTSAAETLVGPIANTVVTTATALLSRTQTSAGESPLGDLVAEAHRESVSADFGITNPGGLRADLPTTCATSPCSVTWNDCFTAQPFGNIVMSMKLTGAQLYAVLEQQWAGQSSPKMLQIAGFGYQWSQSAPVGSRIVAGSLHKTDGTLIDVNATYTVAVNNFLQGGGDGFTVFKSGTNVVPGPVDLDALLAYFKVASQPVSAATDGRVTLVP